MLFSLSFHFLSDGRSRQVAHIVYTLFEKALSLIQELSKFDGTNVVSVWDGLVDMALAQPTHFRYVDNMRRW